LAELGTVARRADFWIAALIAALAGLLLGDFLLTRVTSIGRVIQAQSANPVYLVALAGLASVDLALIAGNAGLLIVLLRRRLTLRPQAGSAVGVIIGGFAVGCPACGAYLLSLVGVSTGLAALPFGGLELWTASIILMAATFWATLRAVATASCRLPEAAPRALGQ